MAIELDKKLTDEQVEQLKKKYPTYTKTWKQLYGEELGTDDKITTKAQLANAMKAIFTTSMVEGVDIGSVLTSFGLSTSSGNLAEAEKIQQTVNQEKPMKLKLYLDLVDLAKTNTYTQEVWNKDFNNDYEKIGGDLKKLLVDSKDGDAPATSEEKEEKEVQPANTTGSWSIEFETKGKRKSMGTRTKTDVEYKWFDPAVKSSQTEETKKTGSKTTTFHTDEQQKKMDEEQKKIDEMTAADKAKLVLDYAKKQMEDKKEEEAVDKEKPAADKKEESADKKEQAADKKEQAADKKEQAADKEKPAADKEKPAADKAESKRTRNVEETKKDVKVGGEKKTEEKKTEETEDRIMMMGVENGTIKEMKDGSIMMYDAKNPIRSSWLFDNTSNCWVKIDNKLDIKREQEKLMQDKYDQGRKDCLEKRKAEEKEVADAEEKKNLKAKIEQLEKEKEELNSSSGNSDENVLKVIESLMPCIDVDKIIYVPKPDPCGVRIEEQFTRTITKTNTETQVREKNTNTYTEEVFEVEKIVNVEVEVEEVKQEPVEPERVMVKPPKIDVYRDANCLVRIVCEEELKTRIVMLIPEDKHKNYLNLLAPPCDLKQFLRYVNDNAKDDKVCISSKPYVWADNTKGRLKGERVNYNGTNGGLDKINYWVEMLPGMNHNGSFVHPLLPNFSRVEDSVDDVGAEGRTAKDSESGILDDNFDHETGYVVLVLANTNELSGVDDKNLDCTAVKSIYSKKEDGSGEKIANPEVAADHRTFYVDKTFECPHLPPSRILGGLCVSEPSKTDGYSQYISSTLAEIQSVLEKAYGANKNNTNVNKYMRQFRILSNLGMPGVDAESKRKDLYLQVNDLRDDIAKDQEIANKAEVVALSEKGDNTLAQLHLDHHVVQKYRDAINHYLKECQSGVEYADYYASWKLIKDDIFNSNMDEAKRLSSDVYNAKVKRRTDFVIALNNIIKQGEPTSVNDPVLEEIRKLKDQEAIKQGEINLTELISADQMKSDVVAKMRVLVGENNFSKMPEDKSSVEDELKKEIAALKAKLAGSEGTPAPSAPAAPKVEEAAPEQKEGETEASKEGGEEAPAPAPAPASKPARTRQVEDKYSEMTHLLKRLEELKNML